MLSSFQLNTDVAVFINLQGHVFDVLFIELTPFCRRHFNSSVPQRGIKHIVDVQVNGVVNPAVHLLKQCVFLDVLAVAGVEVIQIIAG